VTSRFALLFLAVPLVAAARPIEAKPIKAVAARHPAARVKAATIASLIEPSAAGFINAVQVYPFAEGALYRLYAAPGQVTDIVLQPGETITSVAAGDTVRWTVGDTTSGAGEAKRSHILLKPFSAGLRTNLLIATDRRAYHLELASIAGTAMTAISWTYPADELIALRHQQAAADAAAPVASAIPVDRLNFNYAILGDNPAWRPVRAFDDGRQTYVEFPASVATSEAPPLFVIGSTGQAELVNYRMSSRYYVVDRLFGAAELRLGGKRQQVVRIERSDVGSTRKSRAS
jgi:type IV secretion system protein VirB9